MGKNRETSFFASNDWIFTAEQQKREINMAQPSNAVNVLIHDANGKGLLQKPLTQCSIVYLSFLHRWLSKSWTIHSQAIFACGIVKYSKTTISVVLHLLYFPRFLISKENDWNILMQFNQYNRRLEFAWLRNCSEFALSLLLIANQKKRRHFVILHLNYGAFYNGFV